jgi:putative transposase
MTWSQFLEAHWDVLAAADFFTVEVWGLRGLVTFYVFFAIELETRKIEIAGITPAPNEAWMMQIGRNVTDPMDGFLAEKNYLILDRDSKYSTGKATREFAAQYHAERNHQGLENRLIDPESREGATCGPVGCVQRLGGMLCFYRRAVA